MKPISRFIPSPRSIWAQSSGVARFILYLAGVEVFLFLLQQAFRLFNLGELAETLGSWLTSIAFICVVLLLFILVRWTRKKLMWRLRNRLIVTYVFIGVIPVLLLLAMGIVAGELLTGQFATFLVTSDLQHRIDGLDTATSTLANTLAHRLKQGADINSLPGFRASDRFPQRQVTLWYKGDRVVLGASGRDERLQATVAPPGGKEVHAVAGEGNQLFLRASRSVPVGSDTLTVVSSVPLDEALLHDITSDIGQVVLTASIAGSPGEASRGDKKALSAGALPPASNRFDVGVDFAAPISLMDWNNGETSERYLMVSTRPSLLFNRLFANLGSNANAILVVLAVIAILLGLIELLALIIGVRLTRTMTHSVYELYDATQHINRGDFAHRIEVCNHDQLAELETSFNAMSQSLEGLVAEQKEKHRMESELAIAHEVQDQLFPRDFGKLKSLEVHGVCRPARSVSGDYYDFLPLGGENMGIAVADISGKGISAALLMATIHSAMRVYEMGRVPVQGRLAAVGATMVSQASESVSLIPASVVHSPAAVIGLLNRHLFHSTPAEKYATMFLGLWNGAGHQLTYTNAGHLSPFVVRQNGAIEELGVGGTVIGLFDDMVYEETSVKLAPGDLFVAYSDGLTEPENEFGEFGAARLVDLIRKNRNMPLPRISEIVTSSVLDWIGAAEQPDDVTLVLARAI